MEKKTTEKYLDKDKETEDKSPVSHLIKPNTNPLNPDNSEESSASIFPNNNNTESTSSIFPFNEKDSTKSLFPTDNEQSFESIFPFNANANSLDSIFASDDKNSSVSLFLFNDERSSGSTFPFNKKTNLSATTAIFSSNNLSESAAIFSSNNSSASTFPFSSETPDDIDIAGLHRLKANRDKSVILAKKKLLEQQCDTVDGNCTKDEEENEEIIAIKDFCDEILWEIIREIVQEEND